MDLDSLKGVGDDLGGVAEEEDAHDGEEKGGHCRDTSDIQIQSSLRSMRLKMAKLIRINSKRTEL